jgi:hypothetical protein
MSRQQIMASRGSAPARPRPSHWSIPGQTHDVAATAVALLAFLEAGHTHKDRGALSPYRQNVDGGLSFLVQGQQASGYLGHSAYSHALAAIALCEAYRRTKDPALREPAQRALDWTVKAQHVAGGWRYAPQQAGDTSVTSWQILALCRGKDAGLHVPEDVFKRAHSFLDQVALADGAAYSYTPGALGTPTMTAAGLMCRLEMGTAPKGLGRWARQLKPTPSGCFFEFFATRALYTHGGSEWRAWNTGLRTQLLRRQDKDGGWPAEGDLFAPVLGRLMITAVTLLNLQTCARHDPLVPLPSRDLNANELAPLYTALGADDLLKARQAQRQLLAGPRQTVPFLAKTLAPVKAVAPEKIDRLIAGLDASDFAMRQKASAELERLGEQTHAALRRQLAANPSLEVRRRIERILEATADEEATPELRRALRAIEILAHIATPQAHEVLRTLAGGAPGSYVTQAAREALQRLKNASKKR